MWESWDNQKPRHRATHASDVWRLLAPSPCRKYSQAQLQLWTMNNVSACNMQKKTFSEQTSDPFLSSISCVSPPLWAELSTQCVCWFKSYIMGPSVPLPPTRQHNESLLPNKIVLQWILSELLCRYVGWVQMAVLAESPSLPRPTKILYS